MTKSTAKRGSSSTRIFAYIARSERIAVILRRGPSKQVCLIRWDLQKDKLEIGQWLKGRIYERRSDLSPDGKLFGYFAASFKPPFYSWTAISKPPYLTAEVLWPKGDCWGGGGLFENNSTFCLNHGTSQSAIADGFSLPKNLKVKTFHTHPGKGEDTPIGDFIRQQNGWILKTAGELVLKEKERIWVYESPEVWSKASSREKYQLRQLCRSIGNNDNNSWYWMDYDVLKDGEQILDLGHIDWADWDHNGDLLFSSKGKLFRISAKNISRAAQEPKYIQEIADLNGLKFEAKPPKNHALRNKKKTR